MTHQLRSCKLNFALTSCSNEKGKNASILKLHFTTGLTVSTSSLTDKLGKLLKRRKRTVHLGAKATSKPQKNKQIKKKPRAWNAEAGKKTGEITLLCQTRKNTFYLRFFTKFWKQFSSQHGFWSIWWISRFIQWRRFLCPFYCWRNQPNEAGSPKNQQESLRDVDEEIDALINQQPQESASNSNVEVFADDGGEENGESSMRKLLVNVDSEDAPPNPLQWSNILSGINVAESSVHHGLPRYLRVNANSIFSSTTNSLMKSTGTALPISIPKAKQHS